MKATRISVICVLLIAVGALVVMDVLSVMTPINFDEKKAEREAAVKARLIDLRAAQTEYYHVYHTYTDQPDSLIHFLLTTPKKSVTKEGSLGDKQLELLKLTGEQAEKKALGIFADAEKRVRSNKKLKDKDFSNDSVLYSEIWKDAEIIKYGLDGLRFRRDTIETNMLDTLYHGRYTAENIEQIKYIPYSKGDTVQFIFETGSFYSQQGDVPLYEITAPYEVYLWDLDKQLLVNLIDTESRNEVKRRDPTGERNLKPADVVAGLKIGDKEFQNNGQGNWE